MMVKIGEALREARLNKQLSKVKASEEMGISRLTYDMWERGAWVPKIEQCQTITSFTGRSKQEILAALLRLNGVLGNDEKLSFRHLEG